MRCRRLTLTDDRCDEVCRSGTSGASVFVRAVFVSDEMRCCNSFRGFPFEWAAVIRALRFEYVVSEGGGLEDG